MNEKDFEAVAEVFRDAVLPLVERHDAVVIDGARIVE